MSCKLSQCCIILCNCFSSCLITFMDWLISMENLFQICRLFYISLTVKQEVELVNWVFKSFSECQETANLSLCTYTLQPQFTNYISSWCLCLWNGGCHITYLPRWFWMPNCLCFPYPKKYRKKLRLKKEGLALIFGVKKSFTVTYMGVISLS